MIKTIQYINLMLKILIVHNGLIMQVLKSFYTW